MKIFAVDTSSQSASAAVISDGKLLGEFFTNVGLTHSQTILPMIDALCKQTQLSLAEIDRFAVTVGPGSFTGLRIGIATVKGLAHALDKPCTAISTLHALAYGLCPASGVAVPVLDARRSQVYTARFALVPGQAPDRLCEDMACSVSELAQQIKNIPSPVFLVGDGAEMCYTELSERIPNLVKAPASVRYVRAASVALAAQQCAAVSPAELLPTYLRLSQAEREMLQKNKHVEEP